MSLPGTRGLARLVTGLSSLHANVCLHLVKLATLSRWLRQLDFWLLRCFTRAHFLLALSTEEPTDNLCTCFHLMGQNKKKHAGKKASASSALGNEVGNETDSFGAFIDAATAQLKQAALQPGSRSADLIICDSEEMYAEVTELKLESYAVTQIRSQACRSTS